MSVNTLEQTVTPEQASWIVQRLSEVFAVSTPTMYFDADFPKKYTAYAWPEMNEIHFRVDYIPWNAPFHEFAHILYTDYTGNSSLVASEAFAQQFAAMSLTQGLELLDFQCQVCGNGTVKMLDSGMLECLACQSLYSVNWLYQHD